MNVFAVIMAGGQGKRFWPASRKNKPKQFLSIFGKDSMLADTVKRISGIIKNENIFVVTRNIYKDLIFNEIKEIPEQNIILEPMPMDTANAIALASLYIKKRFGDGIVVVLPSDHFIDENEKFINTLNNAIQAAEKSEVLITIGLKPDKPEIGYGYIEKHDVIEQENIPFLFKVKSFKEKPGLNTALEYLKSGKYLWNSGMFVWKNSFYLSNYNTFLPENTSLVHDIEKSINTDNEEKIIAEKFPKLKKISVDFGILEKSRDILCIQGDFIWSDLGTWSRYYEYMEKDSRGNVVMAKAKLIDTENCLVFSDQEKFIGAVDLENIMIINSSNSILVCKKNSDNKIKQLLEYLDESKDCNDFL